MIMRKIKLFFILLLISCSIYGQQSDKQKINSVKFDSILSYFNSRDCYLDSLNPRWSRYQGSGHFIVKISDKPIPLKIKEINLKNPRDNSFPISYSVIYKNRIVSLFWYGFICNSFTMERDTEFEKKINTRTFQYHWILNNELIGLSDNKFYYFNKDNIWVEYGLNVPLKRQPKLFDDSNYICFCDCFGEWGGTIYFYNKKSHKIYYTLANCANSVYKMDKKYNVLSELAHMFGHSDLQQITFPDSLSEVEPEKINIRVDGQALGYQDYSGQTNPIFHFDELLLYASFIYQDRLIYLTRFCGNSFLAEIKNNTIEMVNPLFNNEIWMHDPVSTNYGNIVLINYAHYLTAREREVGFILINDNQLVQVRWNDYKY
jgi:hypothetical protein